MLRRGRRVAQRAAGAHGGASGRADCAAAQRLCGARSRGGDLHSLRVLAGGPGACAPGSGSWLLRQFCACKHSLSLTNKGRRCIIRFSASYKDPWLGCPARFVSPTLRFEAGTRARGCCRVLLSACCIFVASLIVWFTSALPVGAVCSRPERLIFPQDLCSQARYLQGCSAACTCRGERDLCCSTTAVACTLCERGAQCWWSLHGHLLIWMDVLHLYICAQCDHCFLWRRQNT